MSYQPGIPTGSVPLNQDYLNIQANFTQLNTQFQIDHVPLTSTSGNPPNGYHEAIHLVPVSTTSSNPPNNQPINGYTATPGYGQVFNAQINDGLNTDEAFYFLSGGNRLTQLTRNFTPIPLTNNYAAADGSGAVGAAYNGGATFLPGGIIFQWGSFEPGSISPSTGTVKLPQKFTNSSSKIIITPICKSGGTAVNDTFSVQSTTISATQFQWNCTTSTNAYTGFTWIAIGI
jgi:hypothetical protein